MSRTGTEANPPLARTKRPGLLIVNGHIVDAANSVNDKGWVAVTGDRVSSVGTAFDPAPQAEVIVDASDRYVVPGLIDIHTHLYTGVSHYGIDADTYCLGRGVVTAADAGSAGAQTFLGLRKYILQKSATRLLAFVNIAIAGMISAEVGELEDLRWASVDGTVACLGEHRDVAVGVKLRLGRENVGENGDAALRMALEAAHRAKVPLMVHITDSAIGIEPLLASLRPGDIITHAFHGERGGIFDSSRRVLTAVERAAAEGVNFDVGHGAGSFSFAVAQEAIGQGFLPTTISSDLHSHNVNGPVFDLVTTMSKFVALGLDMTQVISMTTCNAAACSIVPTLGS